MALIGRPGRASSPADARHRGGDGLAYRALCGDVQHRQALGFRRRRQGVTRQLPFGGMQQRVRAQDAIQRRQRLGPAEERARAQLSAGRLGRWQSPGRASGGSGLQRRQSVRLRQVKPVRSAAEEGCR